MLDGGAEVRVRSLGFRRVPRPSLASGSGSRRFQARINFMRPGPCSQGAFLWYATAGWAGYLDRQEVGRIFACHNLLIGPTHIKASSAKPMSSTRVIDRARRADQSWSPRRETSDD
jgi:hypothetical protein